MAQKVEPVRRIKDREEREFRLQNGEKFCLLKGK